MTATHQDIPVILSNTSRVSGVHPIIILGPNGAGKTRFAVKLKDQNDANMIAALRNIALPEKVAVQLVDAADRELRQNLKRLQRWQLSGEIGQLFSKLLAEDSSSAIAFRDQWFVGTHSKPDKTKLMTLTSSWSSMFPGRRIDFSRHNPSVISEYSSAGSPYPASQMSDGERVALYLAGRVIDADPGIIIVDEPEVHFHSRLASRFWDELETLPYDCRFVYVTHDLPFARSRQKAQYIIVRPDSDPTPLSLGEGIPDDIIESLLAAATFSIHANRIVFCEGEEGRSIDKKLYQHWFKSPTTAVIPVGSACNVVQCVKAFTDNTIVGGVTAIGIIDRDYWPDTYLASLDGTITPLPVHEAENLLCTPEVFAAVATHLGVTEKTSELYDNALNATRHIFTGGMMSKQVSERFKCRCNHEFQKAMHRAVVSNDLTATKTSHQMSLEPTNWGLNPALIFEEESQRLKSAVSGSAEQILELLPGKPMLPIFAKQLGIKTDAYIELISKALSAEKADPLYTLGQSIASALQLKLPER